MASWMIDVLGGAAALCSMASFTPQLVKIWRERDAEQVSLRMYLVTVCGFALWTLYGALLGRWPLILSNLVSLALASAILVLKLRFSSRRAKEKAAGTQVPAALPSGDQAPTSTCSTSRIRAGADGRSGA